MYCLSDKTLPNDDSDYSIPGRFEDSNSEYFGKPVESKPKSVTMIIIAVSFVMVSAGFFTYYFMNQSQIDSQIIQNTMIMAPEEKIANHHGVGKYGSDHAHAALAVFVNGEQINFGLPPFQLQSKYIHFENHNPYMIHKHATGVPLEMLFTSFGFKITSECIILNYDSSSATNNKFCTDSEHSLVFIVNGQYHSNISEYEIVHNDRILISYGNSEFVSEQLEYLESLRIFDIPKNNQIPSGNYVSI